MKQYVLMLNDRPLAIYTDKGLADFVRDQLEEVHPTTGRMVFFNVYPLPVDPDMTEIEKELPYLREGVKK